MAINRTYESEATQFLRELTTDDPKLVEDRRKARAIWWDGKTGADEARRHRESRVEQGAYVYQTQV